MYRGGHERASAKGAMENGVVERAYMTGNVIKLCQEICQAGVPIHDRLLCNSRTVKTVGTLEAHILLTHEGFSKCMGTI